MATADARFLNANPPPQPLLRRILDDPVQALKVALALAKGHYYRVVLRLRGARFRAGRNFRVFGSLDVRGPGEVIFGNNVSLYDRASPWTYSAEARIQIGDNVMMGRTRFACVQEISIESDCMIAEVTFLDTDFHSSRADRRTNSSAPVRVSPVRVGRNAWLAQHAALLPGSSIGENSVVGYGAVCMRAFPANVVILGNPAKIASPVGPSDAPPSPTFPPGPDATPATTGGAR